MGWRFDSIATSSDCLHRIIQASLGSTVSDLSKTSQKIQRTRDLTLSDGAVNLDLLAISVPRSKAELAGVLDMSRDAVSRSPRLRSSRPWSLVLPRPAGLRLVHLTAPAATRPLYRWGRGGHVRDSLLNTIRVSCSLCSKCASKIPSEIGST